MSSVKKYLHILAVSAMLAGTALLSSCDNAIYDDLPPCTANYALRFRWDYNMLFADAFRENVGSVAVYGFDSDSERLAWIITEKGETLAQEGYLMSLNDIKPGNYKVVAWCGLENDGERNESFIVPQLVVGKSTLSELNCRMEREILEDGTHHSSTDLYDLFHGVAENVVITNPTSPPIKETIYIPSISRKTQIQYVSFFNNSPEKILMPTNLHIPFRKATASFITTILFLKTR